MAGSLRVAAATAAPAFVAPALPAAPAQGPAPAGAARAPRSSAIGSPHSPRAAGPLALAAAALAVASAARRGRGSATGRGVQRRAEASTPRSGISRKEWNDRVKRIQDYRAVFDVTIPKPLGVVPKNFTNRQGVGIASIKKGGNTDLLNRKVILEGMKSMFVLEGDEVVAVDGEDVEGKNLDVIGPLVKNAPGDSITLTLCRNYQKGPVKVVWLPGEEMLTFNRGTLLRKCAETAGADVKYRCKDGWCSSCWHTEDTSDLVHRVCKFDIPKDWDGVKPLVLLRADYAFKEKGLLVKNLMQADGWMPPPPPGVNVKAIRKDVEDNAVSGM